MTEWEKAVEEELIEMGGRLTASEARIKRLENMIQQLKNQRGTK